MVKPGWIPNGWGIATLSCLLAAVASWFTQDASMHRTYSLATLETLLHERIRSPDVTWSEPDPILRKYARLWLPYVHRYPDSMLAWKVSEASIEVWGAVEEDSTAVGVRRIFMSGTVDALDLHEPRLVVTSIVASDGDRSVPVFWCAARADSGKKGWDGEAALADVFPGSEPVLVALACTTWVVPLKHRNAIALATPGLHDGALPEVTHRVLDIDAERMHVRRIEILPEVQVFRSIPRTLSY
jgi:hypothetical protein